MWSLQIESMNFQTFTMLGDFPVIHKWGWQLCAPIMIAEGSQTRDGTEGTQSVVLNISISAPCPLVPPLFSCLFLSYDLYLCMR